jgi:hypothetical protein
VRSGWAYDAVLWDIGLRYRAAETNLPAHQRELVGAELRFICEGARTLVEDADGPGRRPAGPSRGWSGRLALGESR